MANADRRITEMLHAYLARDRVASDRRRYFQAFTKYFHFRARYFGLTNDAIRCRYVRIFLADVIFSAATAFYFGQLLVSNLFVRIQRLIDARRCFAALNRHFVANFVAFISDDLGDPHLRYCVRAANFFCERRRIPYLLYGEGYRIFGVVETNDQIGCFVRVEFFLRR